jgi:phosphoribosyl-ATP pyrophosphohydrolase/phosphoribosyl-AMP cyclohydrolase|tara:strand:- start:6263 stop:6871 length:609 start_codon:yes stop_codon:yes gene_type:complete
MIYPDFKNNEILPAIIQDEKSKTILMLGYMNEEAYKLTLKGPNVWFYSRSRKRLWEKGEKSKNYLEVKKILIDCDYDSILILANPKGPACHTSNYSCFKFLDESVLEKEFSLGILEDIIQKRKEEKPKNSYTTKLFNEGKNKITQKIGEEATEVIVAALAENKINLIEESADLLYHLLVLLSNENISLSEIILKLHERNKKE